MVIIKHARAVFTVQPQNAEQTRELLALIDKSKGRRGRKFAKIRSNPKHESMRRYYPVFEPGMSTADYLARYATLNAGLHLAKVNYEHADRSAPVLDPSIPEVEELPC